MRVWRLAAHGPRGGGDKARIPSYHNVTIKTLFTGSSILPIIPGLAGITVSLWNIVFPRQLLAFVRLSLIIRLLFLSNVLPGERIVPHFPINTVAGTYALTLRNGL